jgi:hypothetical protein
MSSEAIRCHQRQLDVIREETESPDGHEAIRCHQRQLDVIRGFGGPEALTRQKHVLARLGRVGQVLEVPIPLMRRDHVHVRTETVRDRPEESEGN